MAGETKLISLILEKEMCLMKKFLTAVTKAIAESCEAWYMTYRA